MAAAQLLAALDDSPSVGPAAEPPPAEQMRWARHAARHAAAALIAPRGCRLRAAQLRGAWRRLTSEQEIRSADTKRSAMRPYYSRSPVRTRRASSGPKYATFTVFRSRASKFPNVNTILGFFIVSLSVEMIPSERFFGQTSSFASYW
jgi:hypothetical protein